MEIMMNKNMRLVLALLIFTLVAACTTAAPAQVALLPPLSVNCVLPEGDFYTVEPGKPCSFDGYPNYLYTQDGGYEMAGYLGAVEVVCLIDPDGSPSEYEWRYLLAFAGMGSVELSTLTELSECSGTIEIGWFWSENWQHYEFFIDGEYLHTELVPSFNELPKVLSLEENPEFEEAPPIEIISDDPTY